MKKFILAIVMTITAIFANMSNTATAAVPQDKDVVELFIGDIDGVTNQDIRLCQGSYYNGGKYYHLITAEMSLTCERKYISVDFNHYSEK